MPARKKQNKKKTGATRNVEKKTSVFKWLIISLLVGGFTAFLMHLDDIPVQDDEAAKIIQQHKNEQSSRQKLADKKSQNKKDKFHFEFYTELPEREVESYVIEEEEEPLKRKPASIKTASTKKTHTTKEKSSVSKQKVQYTTKPPQTAKTVSAVNKPRSNMLYQLQVGAFSEWAKADAMKGRLALMGVEPNIQVFYANGRKMYRVRIGPSTDEKKIERIKSQLKAQNINTFMQRLKG